MITYDTVMWGIFVLFWIGLFLFWRFIVSPPKRFEKLLKDGSELGLRKIDGGSAECQDLVALLPGYAEKYKLGAVYKTSRPNGYLLEMAISYKEPRMYRGTRPTTRHKRLTRFIITEPTRLAGEFTITLRQKMNLAGKLVFSLLENVGMREIEYGLTEEFKKYFVVYAAEQPGQDIRVPLGLQELFVHNARLYDRGWGVLDFLKEDGQVMCLREGIIIDLSSTIRLQKLDHIKTIVEFGRAVYREATR